MTMEAIWDGFDDWADVAHNFADEGANKRVIPEPDEVFVAAYEYEDYEGDAFVAFRNGDKFYINTGGHCSCYGLEGQWDPQEFDSKELLIAYLERIRDDGYGVEKRHAPAVLARLAP